MTDIDLVARYNYDFRNVDRDAFFKALERNGPKAVQEFAEAFG
jgi:predicted transcriptional regulator